jgi:thiamine-phosphate pyrophosphorylase
LYVISDSVAALGKAVDCGAAVVQLRDKSASLELIYDKAREIIHYKKYRNFLFILNDYPELAAEIQADGVHIGQDFSSFKARSIVGSDFIIGKSTHSLQQGLQAQKEGVNYISIGPVFKTPTKPERMAVGLEYVREAEQKISIPFVAIGGIDLNNIDSVLSAGAKIIGVVRAAKDAAQLLEKIRGEVHASRNKR